MAEPGEGEKEFPIWLVWGLAESGAVVLLVITSTAEIAARYRARALGAHFGQWVRVYVEETRANHLYAGSMWPRAAP